jgi:hypothetical protein
VANEARDVEIDIIARDKTDAGTRAAARNFDKLSSTVKKTTRKMTEDGAKGGVQVGLAFGDNLRVTISRVTPAIAPVLAGVAIAAAPMIGATISGAIIGGAGIGGVLGGVALASRDARVQAAASQLGESILGKLERRAGVFVQPVLAGIGQIDASFSRMDDKIGSILSKSSTFVRPLVTGVTTAFERITSGVDRLVQSAGPVINELGSGVAEVGMNVEAVFNSLADNGVDAAVAISAAFDVVNFTIRAVGHTVNLLTEAYGFLAKAGAFGQKAQHEYLTLEANAKIAAAANDDVGDSFERIRRTASNATVEVKTFEETLKGFRNDTLALAEAQARATLAVQATTEEIKRNNGETANAKERNAQNTLALIDLANQLNAVQVATEKVNGTGVQSTKVSEQNRTAFIAAARAAGYTATEAENLANQYLGIPKNVDTKAKLSKEDAQRNASELRHHLDEIPRTINVRINVHARGISAARRAIHEAGGATGFNAVSHFFAADTTSDSRSRNGGPTPVNVTSNVRVDLDGRPFRDFTTRAITGERDRQDWRHRVGRR